MTEELTTALENQSFTLYPQSIKPIGDRAQVFIATRKGQKAVGIIRPGKSPELKSPVLSGELRMPSGASATLHTLTWENYEKLKALLPISPSRCDRQASFGTGDRLGLVSAAQLSALERHPVFPVIAQQSPRELARTRRDFKSVLLDAVMGVLESGHAGPYGADADHIKDQEHLMAAAEAGYSMYTLDISDWLQGAEASSIDGLSELSRGVLRDCAQMTVDAPNDEAYPVSEQELLASALIYEEALEQVKAFDDLLRGAVQDFDLEISIDEGSRETTPEDHLFVAEYLHRSGIDFQSLAPKFPGKFQKGIDYEGDVEALARSLRRHAALSRQIGGYRLSLHSGSDKFSIYPLLAEITEGRFHIKTSGTSWLQAVKTIASANVPLFRQLYALCLENLEESKKAYDVSITRRDFPAEPPDDLPAFLARPDTTLQSAQSAEATASTAKAGSASLRSTSVRQLFHISYGVLLDNKRNEIFDTLHQHEAEHYALVAENIEGHLRLLF